MEKLMEILEDIRPDVDFETENGLFDAQILSSFDILCIVSDISEEFNILISPGEIVADNFNSAEAMWALISSKVK